jgi:hypothetical protein
VEGGGGGITVSGVSRNRGSFVKCVTIQKKRLGIPGLGSTTQFVIISIYCPIDRSVDRYFKCNVTVEWLLILTCDSL